ncbi:CPBP family intramembrane glutamic endopeptidase [Natronosalvus vescus]|uniref:CPBP family intramembrane glutamic endopeptidase n=1 Tax=Natronosalvus vescus TaxID=2953881 RepID=UPI002091923F|nr:CPBP family intramembrane glutamic endopeptidase [Natronosalvus vescus]
MDTHNRSAGYGRSLLVAVALTIGGIISAEFLTLPAILAEPGLISEPAETSREIRTAFFVLNFAGFFVAGAAYLWWTERGWGFIDIAVPDRRGWLMSIVGILVSIGFVIGAGVLSTLLDIPPSSNQVINFIGEDPTMVLIMIAIVFLFNAPAEEFLFRGVIQKRLYASFTKLHAVLVTSAIFALVHLPAYGLVPGGESVPPSAIAFSITIVFGGSVIFGYLYAITDNLFVPIAAHAGFNAFQFGTMYIVLQYGDDEDIEAITSTLLEVLPVLLEVRAIVGV